MRTVLPLAALLLAAIAAPAASQGADTVTATLDIDLVGVDYKDCVETVLAGSTVAQLLDAAVASGCIDSWTYAEYPGFGRYVTSIDGIPEAVATYWAFYIDGAYAQTGIDVTLVEDGHTYTFDYEQWAVQL